MLDWEKCKASKTRANFVRLINYALISAMTSADGGRPASEGRSQEESWDETKKVTRMSPDENKKRTRSQRQLEQIVSSTM